LAPTPHPLFPDAVQREAVHRVKGARERAFAAPRPGNASYVKTARLDRGFRFTQSGLHLLIVVGTAGL